jgi:hypothetical protein
LAYKPAQISFRISAKARDAADTGVVVDDEVGHGFEHNGKLFMAGGEFLMTLS